MTGRSVVVPVPASTEPPMVVVHWRPAVGARAEVNVDVDDRARCRLPPADRGGVVAVGRRRSCVLEGCTVQEPRAMLGVGRGLWPKAGSGFWAGLYTGWVQLSARGRAMNGSIALVSER